jgi:ubiquinone/menaquinone biosynthesis C-methylase UbiE
MAMHIFKNDFVIEIGSRDNPKIHSDVLCDKFIDDNTQRAGDVVKDRPIVEDDIEYLPFPDKCFDYAICSHVLEHAESPERMFKELMRISHRGYIEAPSEIAERLFGWPFHKWFINLLDNRLVLTRKNSEDSFGLFFHYLLAHDKYFLRLYGRYPQPLIQFHL